MSSTFAWLDFDESARQRMREIVGLLQEEGTVDELGLGRIRDAFSDRFFPGTSVLWRRARYLLFVPWTYQLLDRDGYRQADGEAAARAVQRRLRSALLDHPDHDHDGLIGLRTADPVSPPDSILWAALESWDIRSARTGTLAQYRSTIRRRPLRAQEDIAISTGESVWHPGLPPMPYEFPEAASFKLTSHEAEFLRNRAVEEDAIDGTRAAARRDSLMAWMLKVDDLLETASPWEQPLDRDAADDLKLAVHLAGCFSDVMHGARLVYSRQLAEMREKDAEIKAIEDEAADWFERVTDPERGPQLARWAAELPVFWAVVRGINPAISKTEESFVEAWAQHALADPERALLSPRANSLVSERELHVKGAKARLRADAKDRGDGGSIPQPMTFRWNNALRIAADIRKGLDS